MFAMGFEGPTGFEVRLFRVSSNDSTIKVEQLGEAIEISQAPTALSSIDNGPTRLLLVGTVSGLLLVVSLEEVAGLKLVAEHSLTSLLKCPEPCTISSLAILKRADGVERGILCGLRTGSLVCLTMEMNAKPTTNPGKLPEDCHNRVQPMINTRYLTFKCASTGFDLRASSWSHIRECGSGYYR